jgi:hypothetical protein
MENATTLDLQSRPQKTGMLLAASSQPSQYENQVPAWAASMSGISRWMSAERQILNVSLKIREQCWIP